MASNEINISRKGDRVVVSCLELEAEYSVPANGEAPNRCGHLSGVSFGEALRFGLLLVVDDEESSMVGSLYAEDRAQETIARLRKKAEFYEMMAEIYSAVWSRTNSRLAKTT